MALFTKAVKGTQDVLPAASYKNRFLENTLLDIASRFGFKEIRTPVFEHTELFARGVGDTTDVVQKEMYTFLDKGGRSITLRPEGTAGAARVLAAAALAGARLDGAQAALNTPSTSRAPKTMASTRVPFMAPP